MKNPIAILAGFALAITAITAHAQDAPAPHPCESEPGYQAFDFWVGEWDVYAGDQKVGENIISREEGGCLLLEKWTNASGGTGQSYNYFNPATEKWRQVWVSQAFIIDYEGGLDDNGAMALEGHAVYHASGERHPFRGLWTPKADGSVEQLLEQYDAASESWQPLFKGIYRRQ